jgi:hypothetical protein
VKEPSSFAKLSARFKNEKLIPIAVDERILESYEELQRINIIIPSRLLKKVDEFRKRTGLKPKFDSSRQKRIGINPYNTI